MGERQQMQSMIPPLPRFRMYSRLGDYVRIILESVAGFSKRGPACAEFEDRMAEFTGAQAAICVAKARVGVYLAIRALLKDRPKKVIMSPYTISDIVNMVVCAGGIPVFADLGEGTCNISAEQVGELIGDDVGAVLATHLHGLACDIETIAEWCNSHNVPLVEDAAQALGTRVNGQPVGTFGSAGIFSFGAYKNLNTFFGGMLVTDDGTLANEIAGYSSELPQQELGYYIRKVTEAFITDLATHPMLFRTFTFWIFRLAALHDIGILNSQVSYDLSPTLKRSLPETYLRRMRPLQARLGLAKFNRIDEDSRARIERAELYFEGLKGISDLVLPPRRTDFSHTYSYFPIMVPNRERFVRHMMISRRDVAIQHLKNCADMECFAEFRRDCPVARETSRTTVLLPTYPRYSVTEVERTIAATRQYFSKS